jgi:hypothetical protein
MHLRTAVLAHLFGVDVLGGGGLGQGVVGCHCLLLPLQPGK